MSNPFTLWRGKESVFPETVNVGGEDVTVNADFRVALKILKLYGDPNVSGIWKSKKLLEWFYPELPLDLAGAVDALMAFMSPPTEDTNDPMRKYVNERRAAKKTDSPTFCFEFDAKEIFSSFMQDYGIDLTEIGFMHWYRFLMLLQTLSRYSPLNRKIELRTMEVKDLKGRDKAKLMKAKEEVKIPVKLTEEEISKTRELMAKFL